MSVSVRKIVNVKRSIRIYLTRKADNAAGAAALAGIRRFEVEVQSPSAAREPVANYPGVFTIRDEQGEECLLLSALCGGRDLSVCRFTVRAGGTELAGPKYVEELLDCARSFPYPVADTKKGLQIADIKDAISLGVRHAALNVSEGDFLTLEPDGDNTLEFTLDGRTFWFRREAVEASDRRFRELTDAGIIITLILLNSPKWSRKVPDDLWQIIKHPDALVGPGCEGLISQFNITSDEGLAYYRAFVAFLADRYGRDDGEFGRAVGMIVGNEVNSGWIWCNAGEKDVYEYTEEYADIVRVTYQTAAKYYSGMRIYLSFDHFWTGTAGGTAFPKRYYGAKPMLKILNDRLCAEGNVPWNIAHHPYPQDLNFPDFWNDTLATNSPDAPIITFKNLELLARFTYEPEFLYRGQRRRIILSEQGFNSRWTPESEVLQAMAYGIAYKKVMSIPEIDSFILHAHHDNYREFGLNLGLWRRSEDGSRMVAPKPIYFVFKTIDRKDDKGVYGYERY